jgi:hypothetical protein
MHRFFGLLALSAAALGVWLLFAGPDPEMAMRGSRASAPNAYAGWAIGLLMGLTLAWAAKIDWRNWPARAAVWLRLQRRRLWLIMFGGACASVLLLF